MPIAIEARIKNLNVPDQLSARTNLYQQPPYEDILGDVAKSQGVMIAPLRRYLGELVRDHFPAFSQPGLGDGNIGFAAAMMNFRRNPENTHAIPLHHSPGRAGDVAIVNQMGEELRIWPFWAEYIYNHSSEYRLDGEYFVKGQHEPSSTETYRSWVLKKLKRADRILLSGIEEVFSQDFRNRSTSIVLAGPAVRRGVHTFLPRRRLTD